jgi:WD40 repeat protein
MSRTDSESPHDLLARALAAFDDRLAAGINPTQQEIDPGVDPSLLPDWGRLTAFLSLVEKAWPRGAHGPEDPATVGADDELLSVLPLWDSQNLTASIETTEPHTRQRFGRFQIKRTLGRGGSGIVFLAWDPALKRQVALKVPQPDSLVSPESRKRFEREAHAAASLDHPNIVPVYECGSVGSIAYIAAAFIPGPTLALWLSRQPRPVPAQDAAGLIASLARGVAHAHERKVLHRDLKPSNVLLQSVGSGSDDDAPGAELRPLTEFAPRITDFSLAKLADGLGPETKSGVPFGSPSYMAPEQAEGKLAKIGPPTDIYALGCILYELLTGEPPFMGETQLDTLRQVVADHPTPPRRQRRDLPTALEAVVLKCLEKDPGRRYESARALADDLDRFLAGERIVARAPGAAVKLRRTASRHPVTLVVAGLSILFAIALLGGRYWYKSHLDESRQIAREGEHAARRSELQARHARYVADIRQADQLLRHREANRAFGLLERNRPGDSESDLRDFAWYHLRGRCQTQRRSLSGHRGDVYYVEFSPRGDLLASAGKDGTVRIWDVSSSQLIRTIEASKTEVNVAVFSPDGRSIATVDDDGRLKEWELATGRCLLDRFSHSGEAVVARFTGDGKMIFTGGRKDGRITIWDRSTGLQVDSFRACDADLENAVFSPDGSRLATVGKAGITLWNWPGHTRIASIPGTKRVQGVVFTHDGMRLASAHEDDRTVRLWDVSSGSLLREFRGHTHGVFAVAFSIDDRTILSAGDDGTIRLWDSTTGTERGAHLGHSGRIWNVALSPDGGEIASAGKDGTVRIWSTEPPLDQYRLPIPEPSSFKFAHDEAVLIVSESSPTWSISRWDSHSGSFIDRRPLDVSHSGGQSAISDDGRLLAIADEGQAIMVIDLANGQQWTLADAFVKNVRQLEFSPDGRFLLVSRFGIDSEPLLWHLGTKRRNALPWKHARTCCWTPSGELLTEILGGQLGRWNPETGQTTVVRISPYRPFDGLTLSGDGRLLVTVERSSRKIQLRSFDTLEVEKELAGNPGGQSAIAISPDGKTLASAGIDEAVKLWDIATGEELLMPEGYAGPILFLRFSPDSKALATLSETGPEKPREMRLWLAANDELLRIKPRLELESIQHRD